ncbi:MAG: type II toxin-antitoxin system HicA family toxin [Oscillospiraceae bacterium]|nr:type II toxin-antitoxin system HicA family toxin [Oscillospiraceae bacterium]
MNEKIYEMVLSGKADNNIKYADFQNLIINLGFVFTRQRGSHEIYYHPVIKERMNIQKDGSKAKDYQVRQLRDIILTHGL